MELQIIKPSELASYAGKIAEMRLKYFKLFPYLYQGDLTTEKKHTENFTHSPGTVLAVGLAHNEIVAIATGYPLNNEVEIVTQGKKWFAGHRFNPNDFFYIGEIIIDEKYRKQGWSSKLFKLCEQMAIQQGFSKICFASVMREKNHPLEPENYQSNDAIFAHCGYTKTDFECNFKWPTLQSDGQVNEENNRMTFWLKEI